MNTPISLNYHQAQAVAERAQRVRKLAGQRRRSGYTGSERVVVTVQNPYTTPETHGLYLEVDGRPGTRSPLFAKDLGYERNFEASRLPARDVNGHLYHPDFDGIGDDEYDMGPQLRSLGWHSVTTSFENDADEAMQSRYYDAGEPDCSFWTPTPPEGEGWLLAAIYDTEDGPVALFVRKAEDPAGVTVVDASVPDKPNSAPEKPAE